MSDQVITFYDIASVVGGSISPYTWRTRLALNLKKLPYRTHFLQFVEIEDYMKNIGAKPTGRTPDDAADWYTLPVIAVPSTDLSSPVLVEESGRIAEYLDSTYPSTSKLFPEGTRALQTAFAQLFASNGLQTTLPVLVPGCPAIVNEENARYFSETRAKWFGTPLSEWAPLGSAKRAELWRTAEQGWAKLAAVYEKRDAAKGPWLTGALPVYADILVVALMAFAKPVIPEEEFESWLKWHDGIWGRLWTASLPFRSEDH